MRRRGPVRRYRLVEGGEGRLLRRDVYVWRNEGHGGLLEAHFRCPCGMRALKVVDPPHGISYDAAGLLTVRGSIGSRATPRCGSEPARPTNWCHFSVTAGEPAMYSDARCPGGAAAGNEVGA